MRMAMVLVAASVTGCGTMLESIPEKLSRSQDWELCYSAVAGEYAHERELAGGMVRSRRIDCNQHMPMVHARMQARSASDTRTMQLLMLGNQISTQGVAQPRVPSQPSGHFIRQYVSGWNRMCVYNRVGSEYVMTIASSDMCPLSP